MEKDPRGIPIEVLELGKQLGAAIDAGDEDEIAKLKLKLQADRYHGHGWDEIEMQYTQREYKKWDTGRSISTGLPESKKRFTKSQHLIILKEANRRFLLEYGQTFGKVSWYEDDESDEGVLFNVEGHGEGLSQDQVWDIANDSGDDEIAADIAAAVEDWEDYMYSS